MSTAGAVRAAGAAPMTRMQRFRAAVGGGAGDKGVDHGFAHIDDRVGDVVRAQEVEALVADDAELSLIAKRVLGYLEKDLTHSEIATLIGITRQAVGDTMRRYGITRKQLLKNRGKNEDL